jgi:uncharacterized membrane protein YeaQ/YmgE (transglycosylase-associated protein family)
MDADGISPVRDGAKPLLEIKMSVETLLIWLVVGAIAGWLAGVIVKGYGLGLIGNIVVGILGAFIGGWLLGRLGVGVGSGIVGSIIGATVGAVILLLLLRLVRRA